MADLDSNIRYIFTMTDNVSTSTDTISDSAVEAQNNLHQVRVEQEQLEDQTERTNQALTKQQAQFLTNAAVLMTMQSSVSAVTGGLVAIVLYPLIIDIFRHRRPTLTDRDYFDLVEHDEPLPPPSLQEMTEERDH